MVVKEVEEGSWKGRKGCGDEDRGERGDVMESKRKQVK